MKRILSLLVLIALLFVGMNNPKEVLAASRSSIVIEAKTGRILYQNNAFTRLPMASTTKIMTALVALEEGDLDSEVMAGPNAAGVEGSSMYLRLGDTLTLGDLVTALLFVSANDGAVAISEHMDGSVEKFCARMNRKAKELGCGDTNFVTPHGLPAENHYTTAYDLARIAAYAIQLESFREITSARSAEITVNGQKQMIYNKDKFLNLYEYAIGVKTGYTDAAGRCFVSAAEKDGMILCGVVLNSTDMYVESRANMEECYGKFQMVNLAEKGDYVASIPVEHGEENLYRVRLSEEIDVPLTKEEEQAVSLRIDLKESLEAPVEKNRLLGSVSVLVGNDVLLNREIYSEYEIERHIPFYKKIYTQWKVVLQTMF